MNLRELRHSRNRKKVPTDLERGSPSEKRNEHHPNYRKKTTD
jgi:hypothetical protein